MPVVASASVPIEKREQNFAEVRLNSGAGCTKGG